MISKVLFWSGFGVAVRLWQLGIEMRPFFYKKGLWAYPVYATIGGGFGYWLEGVSYRQNKLLQDRKESLLEKRRRRAERDAQVANEGSSSSSEQAVIAGT